MDEIIVDVVLSQAEIDAFEKYFTAVLTSAAQAQPDAVRQKPSLERKREWLHGAGGRGDQCPRSAQPIYTDPQKVPDTCRDYQCDNTDWKSGGIIQRDKYTKQVVHREKKTEP